MNWRYSIELGIVRRMLGAVFDRVGSCKEIELRVVRSLTEGFRGIECWSRAVRSLLVEWRGIR